GRKRGGQSGHRAACRALLPVEQVDKLLGVVPERCGHCGQPFPATTSRSGARFWRHQVVELLPLAVWVIEYRMGVRRCPACEKRTRGDLPAGVPRRPFRARLTAGVTLLSGRFPLYSHSFTPSSWTWRCCGPRTIGLCRYGGGSTTSRGFSSRRMSAAS